ncbi:hypothetical protein MYX78_00295 [Acidobacteria bacterium AH-259-G07]|nr:hypothetical protein [Acidobacteria bacterium AH-259-G07]
MFYPTVEEFKEVLLARPLDSVVNDYIFTGTPFVFRGRPETMNELREHLLKSLSVSEQDVVVVGSAKIGFSLNPHNFSRQFTDQSDIDIVVVNETLFDKIWKVLLSWSYPRRYRLVGSENEWEEQRKDDLYWGWFRPDKIRYEGLSLPRLLEPLRDLSTDWFNAFQSLSIYSELAARDVSGRLYRTWPHALMYYENSLGKIKKIVQEEHRI